MTRQTSKTSGVYAVGTLRYTSGGLVVLFVWLLWGDFCFSLFEAIFGRFMPLYMKEFHASNTVIGLLTGSIAGAINILFLPNISMWSDRYRSRWGRRIPFLFWATPCTVLSLILIGYAPEIGAWLQRTIFPLRAVSTATIILLLLGTFTVSWHFFNMVLVNMFRFLQRDVVPQEAMPRFLSYFQVVGTAAGFTFSWFVFPHVLSERKLVCTGVGLVYLVGFLLMCWRVKEGNYLQPPEQETTSAVKSFLAYFRECLSISIYRDMVITLALVTTASSCTAPFSLLFVSDTLRVSMNSMGKIYAVTALASAFAMIPMGYLCARFGAIRVSLIALICLSVSAPVAWWLVRDGNSWIVYSILMVIPNAAWGLGFMAMQMQLFPGEKFGQFFSSLNVLGYGSIFLGNYLVGSIMDYTHSNYRMTFIVALACYGAAIVPMTMVYRSWKRHGGPDSYIPPLPAQRQL